MNIQKAVKQSQKLMYASIAILLLSLVFISQFISSYIQIENDFHFVFPYGVVVTWGAPDSKEILIKLDKFITQPYEAGQVLFDEFDVEVIKDSAKIISNDCIKIQEINLETMLAISHPIAQSLRLAQIEDEVLHHITKISHIPQDLATKGKISENKKQISKMQGTLYQLKSKISLEYSVLDKPEFFWENPEYDHYYTQVSNYLELPARIEIISRKTETIDQILSILSDELNHRHSSKLEIIIILLILFEVVIFILKDLANLI